MKNSVLPFFTLFLLILTTGCRENGNFKNQLANWEKNLGIRIHLHADLEEDTCLAKKLDEMLSRYQKFSLRQKRKLKRNLAAKVDDIVIEPTEVFDETETVYQLQYWAFNSIDNGPVHESWITPAPRPAPKLKTSIQQKERRIKIQLQASRSGMRILNFRNYDLYFGQAFHRKKLLAQRANPNLGVIQLLHTYNWYYVDDIEEDLDQGQTSMGFKVLDNTSDIEDKCSSLSLAHFVAP